MGKWNDLLHEAEDELRAWVMENRPVDEDEVPEKITEIADSHVPIYYGDLIDLAQDNMDLVNMEPEILAYDGRATAVNCIAGRAYEEIEQHLWEVWRNHEDEWTSDPDEIE